MRSLFKKLLLVCLFMAIVALVGHAQQATTPEARAVEAATQSQEKLRRVIRRPASTPTRIIVAGQSETNAPQVVTLVHQLSAAKILRLLLRQRGENDVVATMNQPLTMSDLHTNIIAGLAFDDGRTIAVWLPQAAAEIDAPLMLPTPSEFLGALSPMVRAADDPNLSVVLGDGKRLHVSYIGLDGITGISVLRANIPTTVLSARDVVDKLVKGQRVRLVAPQLAETPANVPPGTIYARIGEAQVTLDQIVRTSAGKVEHLTATAANLSPEFVGGIALNAEGETVGVVEEIGGNRARLLPASAVDAAVRRVLKQQASVPRPLLGVQGEPVELTSRKSLLAYGWSEQSLSKFFAKPSGIFVTSVFPGTPAAVANFHPGDIIVRVNDGEVKSVDDFSFMLGEAGSGAPVNFTVLMPNHPTPESVMVKLGGSFQTSFEKKVFTNFATTVRGPLAQFGIETIAVSTRFNPEPRSLGGLLVVSVQPDSSAAQHDMREGDIIESIDGQPAVRAPGVASALDREKQHNRSRVRGRQHLQVILAPVVSKQP